MLAGQEHKKLSTTENASVYIFSTSVLIKKLITLIVCTGECLCVFVAVYKMAISRDFVPVDGSGQRILKILQIRTRLCICEDQCVKVCWVEKRKKARSSKSKFKECVVW